MYSVVRQVVRMREITVDDCRALMTNLCIRVSGDYFDGVKFIAYIEAIAVFFDEFDNDVSKVYDRLSSFYKAMGRLPEALEWQTRCKEIRETLFPDGLHPSLATTYDNLSVLHTDLNNEANAIYWAKKAEGVRSALFRQA